MGTCRSRHGGAALVPVYQRRQCLHSEVNNKARSLNCSVNTNVCALNLPRRQNSIKRSRADSRVEVPRRFRECLRPHLQGVAEMSQNLHVSTRLSAEYVLLKKNVAYLGDKRTHVSQALL